MALPTLQTLVQVLTEEAEARALDLQPPQHRAVAVGAEGHSVAIPLLARPVRLDSVRTTACLSTLMHRNPSPCLVTGGMMTFR